ncbi:dihydrofolate reductase family protein [Terrimonas sp. NA20]|uniref:Dihydrofolate reductase family protein n=1 Tax=Terrimonas ginsenosidimutans TaxID=2908004 RepID=A0ABS9KJZ1_9BACT|nr:dihydrofolate reductase family protein [Terrimonas ginsenosidimutans]MCG2612641.1 dihydrofolate reductase family protein [Terrimonas ginsenosidimutans]
MRKLILSMNITLDGFIAGPRCELDWHFSYWNSEMARYAANQLALVDTILLGRVTYTAMAKHWPFVLMDDTFPRDDIAFADMMNTHSKFVFSNTLAEASWYNSTLVKEEPASAIRKLKRMPGKDMIIFGSGRLAKSLIKQDLIDEYILWTYPVILGEGKTLFGDTGRPSSLRLVTSTAFSSGVVLMDYHVCRSA